MIKTRTIIGGINVLSIFNRIYGTISTSYTYVGTHVYSLNRLLRGRIRLYIC